MFGKEDTFGTACVCEAEFSSLEIHFYNVVERQMFGIAEQTSGRCSVQWRQMFDTADVKQMFGADEADVWYIRHV